MAEPEFAMRTPLTTEQADDLWRAIREWQRIWRENNEDAPLSGPGLWDIPKSCLMGRMTLHGKDPLPHPPPTAHAAPWYQLIDEGRVYLPLVWQDGTPMETDWYVGGPYEAGKVLDTPAMVICHTPWELVEVLGENDYRVAWPNYGTWRLHQIPQFWVIEREEGQQNGDPPEADGSTHNDRKDDR